MEIGQIDIIGRGISKTPAREELIDFSSVYYKGAAQFIALASLPKPAEVNQSSFSNRRIGVQKATSFEEWIRDNLVSDGYVDLTNVYLYSNAVDLMKGLDRGDVDLVIIDQDVYESLYQSTGDYQVFYEGFLEEDYAFGLQKGSTLTDVVNGHLEDMMKDGTAQQIADRFFSMDFYADSSSGFPEDCVTIYWSTEGASSADIYVDSSPVSQWNDPNGSMMLCNEVSGLGGHQIQLHAVSDASDAWADLQYTTMGHPTGLIVPTPEEEHATGLIVP